MNEPIHFDDGAAYERYMGVWSQTTGAAFLRWLAPQPGLQWLDVGCGSGAFTEIVVRDGKPASVQGIDPSAQQLAYARARPGLAAAQFHEADAMALPFADDSFDVAVMPLVIFFVPEPARGVAEMARVVRPGGTVSAYGWDMAGGGFPYHQLRAQMQDGGVEVPTPPNADASSLEVLPALWVGAGLDSVEIRQITVHRTFADFEDYWHTILGGPSVSRKLGAMSAPQLALLKARMRSRLPSDATGRITCSARANAVKGRVRG